MVCCYFQPALLCAVINHGEVDGMGTRLAIPFVAIVTQPSVCSQPARRFLSTEPVLSQKPGQ